MALTSNLNIDAGSLFVDTEKSTIGLGTTTPDPFRLLHVAGLAHIDSLKAPAIGTNLVSADRSDPGGILIQANHLGVGGTAIAGQQGGIELFPPTAGVFGHSTDATGVVGYSNATFPIGSGVGVFGEALLDEGGAGVLGRASHPSGMTYGVRGHVLSPNGYAGYFEGGRNYFEVAVGFGTTSPTSPLHVHELSAATFDVLVSVTNPSDQPLLTIDDISRTTLGNTGDSFPAWLIVEDALSDVSTLIPQVTVGGARGTAIDIGRDVDNQANLGWILPGDFFQITSGGALGPGLRRDVVFQPVVSGSEYGNVGVGAIAPSHKLTVEATTT